MPRALELLAKAAPRHVERRTGKHKGGVVSRTIVAGRSYDHVRVDRGSGDVEIHPTNLHRPLGRVFDRSDAYEAQDPHGRSLGRHADAHKAARAVVQGYTVSGGGNQAEDPASGTGMADHL